MLNVWKTGGRQLAYSAQTTKVSLSHCLVAVTGSEVVDKELSAELLNKGNLWKVQNVVFNPSSITLPDLTLITLDAVKAFDKVEGDYFFFLV